MTDFVFEKAEASDAEAIANAEREIFSDAWSFSSVTAFLSSPLSRSMTVKEKSGALAGYCLFQWIAPEGEILRIATLPAYRRKGLAAALFNSLLKALDGERESAIYLEVRAQNAPAIALYESLGFSAYDLRKNYYKNPTDDAKLMRKIGQ